MYVDVYKKSSLANESKRAIEYRIFAEITGELTKANDEGAAPQSRINALFRNSQLWLTLEADLVSSENKLDHELKAGLISLAIWVRRFTTHAMRNREDLEPLISVNRQIMEGLMMSEKNARKPKAQEPYQNFAQMSA
ncbi:flagellar biosynthesis regulator FlaF [Sneathiella sp. P13V-1]|uniref:flagellar biosynthesis regulator FlaF n=1 Tax=Sneathiella sp. P13V-1 TaxID=2697366 RepID=UPI00187B526C|nr:flagellar biosynthesis regulator FlaF [Sneathiella sp. P13V-1]MBE7635212.1 flagellar biosynthesis regulator FlaF [Sneathiella sp. P13V-1]